MDMEKIEEALESGEKVLLCADGFYVLAESEFEEGHFALFGPSEEEELLLGYAKNPQFLTDCGYFGVPRSVLETVLEKHGGLTKLVSGPSPTGDPQQISPAVQLFPHSKRGDRAFLWDSVRGKLSEIDLGEAKSILWEEKLLEDPTLGRLEDLDVPELTARCIVSEIS